MYCLHCDKVATSQCQGCDSNFCETHLTHHKHIRRCSWGSRSNQCNKPATMGELCDSHYWAMKTARSR